MRSRNVPAALVSRIDLDLLYPRYLETLLEVLARCHARGARYIATYGFRTEGEQMAIWAQGRTQPGKIVTGAKAWESMHNYGLAVDLVRDADFEKAGLQPAWEPAGYDLLREECELLGLQAGLTRKDGTRWDHGHVQYPIRRMLDLSEKEFLSTLKPLATGDGGLKSVWEHLDRILPVFPY